ncbi:MAG: CBS domain-containing protein [Anaerolineales bacterium]|nr:MAG: CBS domain-containing protein [Chloroflexota bacterium]MBE7435874.1 CBS domain-containing protein [Anaerolineales bacterium]MCE7859196.1 CBS domain-containing protein [Chloroflexi bacterium CFX2]MCK6583035.1 CBS domain-containing protein [Anaerolineales bacterium]GJQ37457.1 MAG: histidine kinase [Anaerolineaceae bacterium]
MTTVRKLLEVKENAKNFSVESSQTVLDALRVMADARIGAVLVTDNGKIVGIYTERDYLYKGELAGRIAGETPLRDVMTSQMFTVNLNTSVEQCMGLMKQHRLRHLPVVENEKLLGIVSMRDVLLAAIELKDSEIRGLENYIMGSGFQS